MKNMTEGRPGPLLVKFAIPLLIGNIFQQVYNFVDTIVVGRYLGEQALAGVGNTGSLIFFLTALIMGICSGGGIIVAQCFGAREYGRMRRVIPALVWVTGGLTILVMVVGIVFNETFLGWLSVPEDVIGYSIDYLHVLYWFIGGTIIYNACATLLRSFGDSKSPLIALIIGTMLNVALDLLFIIVFGMGVKGVAYATAISQHVAGAYCLIYLIRKREMYELINIPRLPDREMVWLIIKTGVPMAFQNCLIALGNMSVQRLINSFGSAVMAAYAAAVKIDSIAIQVILSMGTALSVYTSQNIGLKLYGRIKEGLRTSLVIMTAMNLVIAAVAIFAGDKLMILFLGSRASLEVVSTGAQYLSFMGAAYLVGSVMRSYQNVIHGAGDVNTVMVAGMTELFARVGLAYLLAPVLGITGVWMAVPMSWACACVVPVVRYYSGKWKDKAMVEGTAAEETVVPENVENAGVEEQVIES